MPERPCGCPEDYHLNDCPILRPPEPYEPDQDDFYFIDKELDYRNDR